MGVRRVAKKRRSNGAEIFIDCLGRGSEKDEGGERGGKK